MSEKSIKKSKISKKYVTEFLVVLLFVPGTLVLSWQFGDRKYYLCSLLLIVYAMLPFLAAFEQRKPQARELVTIAVMSAIAVASRAAFIMVPFFKPITGVIMITGIAFGPEAGFLTGAISGFVSNFIFGQGPWTPWQMFAFGAAGFLAGLFGRWGIMNREKKIQMSLVGGIVVMIVVGPLLDTSTLFTMSTTLNLGAAASVYLAGVPVNAVHALATLLTLFLVGKPMLEKLDRIKVKYGMMDGENDEI